MRSSSSAGGGRTCRSGCCQPIDAFGQDIGAGFDLFDELADRLATMIENLHERADADGQQKSDDQRRHRAPQRRLSGQQPPISRFGDRLCQSFDESERTDALRTSARAMPAPFGLSSAPSSEGCAASLRINFIGIENRILSTGKLMNFYNLAEIGR